MLDRKSKLKNSGVALLAVLLMAACKDTELSVENTHADVSTAKPAVEAAATVEPAATPQPNITTGAVADEARPAIGNTPKNIQTGESKLTDQSKVQTSFEEMMGGFLRCEFNGVYIDAKTGKARHQYLIERNLTPCKTKPYLVTYCVNESFHGIVVKEFSIPNDTWPIHVIYFEKNLSEMRRVLKLKFGSEFRAPIRNQNSMRPILMRDPDNNKKSMLICSVDK